VIVKVRVYTPSIKKLREILYDTTPVNAAVAGKWMASIREQVRRRGDRFGAKWPAYSRLTMYSKRLRGPKGRMLEGLLKFIEMKFGKTFAEIYSTNDIVAYHHYGTTGPYPIPKSPGKLAYPHPEGRISQLYEGKWVFGKKMQVQHPGVARRSIFPSDVQALEMAKEIVRRTIRDTPI